MHAHQFLQEKPIQSIKRFEKSENHGILCRLSRNGRRVKTLSLVLLRGRAPWRFSDNSDNPHESWITWHWGGQSEVLRRCNLALWPWSNPVQLFQQICVTTLLWCQAFLCTSIFSAANSVKKMQANYKESKGHFSQNFWEFALLRPRFYYTCDCFPELKNNERWYYCFFCPSWTFNIQRIIGFELEL